MRPFLFLLTLRRNCPVQGPLTLQCSVGQADLAVGGDVCRPSACDFCSREDGYPRAESPGFSRSANGATDLDPNDSFSRYSVQRASPSGCRADSSDLVARAQRPPAKGCRHRMPTTGMDSICNVLS